MKALFFLAGALLAASPDFVKDALYLSGVMCEEDLSASEFDAYSALEAHPVALNSCSRAVLLSCGLFSAAQANTLYEYRKRYGAILSYTELSFLDGFDAAFAQALKSFTLLDNPKIGLPSRKGASVSGLLRGGLKLGGPSSVRLKLNTSYSSILRADLCADNTALKGWEVSYTPARAPLSLTLGDFYARFGQGLTLWNGFSLSGVSSPQALKKKALGLTPCSSFSLDTHFRGACLSAELGSLSLCALADFKGPLAANATYLFRSTTLGTTVLLGKDAPLRLGADFLSTVGEFSFYGEATGDLRARCLAGVLGLGWNAGYKKEMDLVLRAYPAGFDPALSSPVRSSSKASDEAGASLGIVWGLFSLSADAAVHPSKETEAYKCTGCFEKSWKFGPVDVKPYWKGVIRYRTADKYPLRLESRGELTLSAYGINAHCRLDFVKCRNLAWMGYAELGYKGEWSLWARYSLFLVDDWNDRIYVYQRDVPGTFSSVVCYGRGYSLSLYVSWRGLALSATTTQYRWTPGKAPTGEVKLQWKFSSQKFRRRPTPKAGEELNA